MIDKLTITEAAEFLKISATTLRRYDKSGKLVANRTPGGPLTKGWRFYTVEQLQRFKAEVLDGNAEAIERELPL